MRDSWLGFLLACILCFSAVSMAQDRGGSAFGGMDPRGASPLLSPGPLGAYPTMPGRLGIDQLPMGTGGIPRITNRDRDFLLRDQLQMQQFRLPSQIPYQLFQEPEPPNEFQDFIAASTGRYLPLFGYKLFSMAPTTFAPADDIPATPDYVIGAGDEIIIRGWGQVDIDYRAFVDRNGQIHIPQIGTLTVGGLRYQDLYGFIRNAVAKVFRNFELSVNLGQLRSIQVFVVGQARRPGAYTVSALSTLVNALFVSGGPSNRGSMRNIQLKRGEKVVSQFDVYDLLVKGDKSKDVRLLPGDVIYIPPVGTLVAISGSVKEPAIYEINGAGTLGDLVDLAGGLSAVALGQKAIVERIVDRRVRRVAEFTLDGTGMVRALQDGDLVQIQPLSPRFDNAVTLRGAVAVQGRVPWQEGMRVRDLIPDKEALIVPEYWQRLNQSFRNTMWRERETRRLDDPRDLLRRPDDQRDAQRGSDQQRDARRTDEPRDPRPEDLQNVRRPEDLKDLLRTEDPRDARRPEDPRDRRRTDEARDMRGRGDVEQRLRTEIKRNFDEINWDYAVIERLNYDDLTTALIPFNLGRAVLEGDAVHNIALRPGDIVTIFSKADIQVPAAKQTQFVRLEGELVTPGVYQILPGETLRQLLVRVGGITPTSYLYGAEFTRESVKVQQQRRLDDALDRLAAEVERNAAARAQSAPEAAPQATAQAENQRRLVARMREIRATGRVVLDIPPDATRLASVPDIPLEDGDRLVVPLKPATVSVIGAVYNQNTFIYESSKRVGDYLQNAGGTTRDADTGRVYVVRADGSVTGKASGSVFTAYTSERLEAGDTVVVPENLERYRFTRELKDWSQIFYQFALGVAGLKVLRDL